MPCPPPSLPPRISVSVQGSGLGAMVVELLAGCPGEHALQQDMLLQVGHSSACIAGPACNSAVTRPSGPCLHRSGTAARLCRHAWHGHSTLSALPGHTNCAGLGLPLCPAV